MTNFINNALNNMLSKGKNKSAPIAKQHQWKNMSPQQKTTTRMRWKDSDGDGIPNRWDCQSRNPFRQDTIDPYIPPTKENLEKAKKLQADQKSFSDEFIAGRRGKEETEEYFLGKDPRKTEWYKQNKGRR